MENPKAKHGALLSKSRVTQTSQPSSQIPTVIQHESHNHRIHELPTQESASTHYEEDPSIAKRSTSIPDGCCSTSNVSGLGKLRESFLSTPRQSQNLGHDRADPNRRWLRRSGSQRRISWDSENRRLPSTTGSVRIESGCGAHWTWMQTRSQSRLGGRGHRLKFLLFGARWRSRSDSSTECFRACTQLRGDLGFRDTVL